MSDNHAVFKCDGLTIEIASGDIHVERVFVADWNGSKLIQFETIEKYVKDSGSGSSGEKGKRWITVENCMTNEISTILFSDCGETDDPRIIENSRYRFVVLLTPRDFMETLEWIGMTEQEAK